MTQSMQALGGQLPRMALANAKAAAEDGDLRQAVEWLEMLAKEHRPRDLEADIHYRLSKKCAQAGKWDEAELHLRRAFEAKADPLLEKRLGLMRRRQPAMDERSWHSMNESIDPALRMDPAVLQPEVAGVWACGSYHPRGRGRALPWSRMLPLAKNPPIDDEERGAIMRLTTGYFCRFIASQTPLLGLVDVVVSIPANPGRYALRMMSLPDELARSTEHQLALPFLMQALVSGRTDIELRGLSWAQRRNAVRDSMQVEQLGLGAGRKILVVDDISTSGATLKEAARILLQGGAEAVYGAVLSHTEG